METRELIELTEASELLGVHPSTLRRWADAGKIQHVRTLGGQRRFERAAIEDARAQLQPELASALSQAPESEQFEEQTLDHTRQRTSELAAQPATWMRMLSDEQRMLFRYGGQRLLGLMMQFISRSDPAKPFLEEGRRVAGDYGQICARAGLSAAQTAEAFLYFRRSILESVASTRLSGSHDPDGDRIFLRTVDFFDALLVATIESHGKGKEFTDSTERRD